MQAATIAPDRITKLCNAFQASKALLSAAELGIFTTLAESPMDTATLAEKISIAGRGARDFFDALVALGLLERSEQGLYSNAPESNLYLDRRKPTYIGGALAHANMRVYPHWTELTQALRTGTPQSEPAATDFYSVLYSDAAMLEAFAKGMSGSSLLVAKALATKFPWREYKSMIDIGTAQGCLPVEIAETHSHMVGGGFDLPQVRSIFEVFVRDRGLSDRLSFYPGDFMSEPLPKADVLVMGRILHNWGLAAKKLLLRKAHDALAPGGCLIVYERLIDDDRRTNSAALLASLNMLIMTAGGFEFTGTDCIGWMREAGFRGTRVEPLAGELSMVVGTK